MRTAALLIVALYACDDSTTQGQSHRYLLRESFISDQVRGLQVTQDAKNIVVHLEGESVQTNAPFARPLASQSLQVWLLNRNGTTITEVRSPTFLAIGHTGWKTDAAQFWFLPVPAVELVAVVVSVDGTTFQRNFDGHGTANADIVTSWDFSVISMATNNGAFRSPSIHLAAPIPKLLNTPDLRHRLVGLCSNSRGNSRFVREGNTWTNCEYESTSCCGSR